MREFVFDSQARSYFSDGVDRVLVTKSDGEVVQTYSPVPGNEK